MTAVELASQPVELSLMEGERAVADHLEEVTAAEAAEAEVDHPEEVEALKIMRARPVVEALEATLLEAEAPIA